MNPQQKAVVDRMLRLWKGLGPLAKMAFVSAAILAALLFAVSSSDHSTYAYLFTGLESADAGEILAKLKEQHVPYQIENSGAIMVPETQVHELRLQLAQEGLPKGGGVGFELFDRSQFGQSEFVQQKNYLRALQGELERTIAALGQVQKARVLLVVPERRLFRAEDELASASVMVKLRGGRALSEGQVQGIVHLVAASVPRLSADRVTLVDDSGQPLSGGEGNAAASGALDFKHKLERDYEHKIRSLLERVVGVGKASVQVAAETDLTQTERTEEIYDAERTALRSEQVSDERSQQGQAQSGGIPGARSNLPGGAAPQAASQPDANSTNHHGETRNYEVGKTVNHTVLGPARLVRLSVAAAVDGSYSGDGAARHFSPRAPEEMEAMLALVRQAAGLDTKRGDQIELRCIQFAVADDTEGQTANPLSRIDALRPYVPFAALGLGAIMVVLFAFGALRHRSRVPEPLPALPLPRSLKELTPMLEQNNQTSHKQQPLALHEAVGRDQERTLSVVRGWLGQSKPEGVKPSGAAP